MVNPESVIVDLLCNESESLCYSFFNPSNREAILVTGQIVEDIEGVYRKISSYPMTSHGGSILFVGRW